MEEVIVSILFLIILIKSIIFRKIIKEMFVYLGKAVHFEKYKVPVALHHKTSKKKYGIPRWVGKIIYPCFKLLSWMYVILLIILIIWSVCIVIENNSIEEAHELIAPEHFLGPQIGLEEYPNYFVEFGCYNCEETKESFTIVREMLQKYHGKIMYQYIDVPRNEESQEISSFMFCIQAIYPEQYWVVHGYVRDRVQAVNIVDLKVLIDTFSFEEEDIVACMNSEVSVDALKKQEKRAKMSGVEDIPTFFINGKGIQNPESIEEIEMYITS